MEKPTSLIPKLRTQHKNNLEDQKATKVGVNRIGLRRSKSFSDITFGNTKPAASSCFSRLLNKPSTSKTIKSSSVTNLNSVSSATTPSIVKDIVVGTKRPLTHAIQNVATNKRVKPETKRDELKENNGKLPSKPIKPPKLASYDYKGRFNQLTEKHTTLRTTHNDVKHELLQVKDELNHIREEHSLNLQKISELTKQLTELTNSEKQMKQKYDDMLKRLDLSKAEVREKTCNLQSAQEQLEVFKQKLHSSEATRRALHNTVQSLKGNIRVFCRIRPPLYSEDKNSLCNIKYIDEASLELYNRDNHKADFVFDKVFPPQSSQADVFEDIADLVQSALDGYNVCVFAYGQTGSGKTYTMQGEPAHSDLGMIPRSMDLLFKSIQELQKVGWEYTVEASFLEIYNEIIRDLLDLQPKQHEIRYNEGKGITVTNLKIQPIESAEDFRQFMETAAKYRAVAATNFNEHSSRSHALTKVYINGVNKNFKVSLKGSLNLIDLAGSESAKTSSDERLCETKHINRSLSALGNVILALHNKDNYVPFRNSKLTYLLQSCLSGNSKTLMVVNISPFQECYNETISSLRFACQVKCQD